MRKIVENIQKFVMFIFYLGKMILSHDKLLKEDWLRKTHWYNTDKTLVVILQDCTNSYWTDQGLA